MEKVPMTSQGLASLEEDLKRLKEERPVVSKAIGVAREHGDLSENAEYHAAKERQGIIEAQMKEIEGLISHAEVIDSSKFSGDMVKFGATVMVVDEETDEENTYQIVGSHEANAKNGTISVTAPLARALIGKTLGDVVEVRTPGGSKSYEIIGVAFK